MKNITKNILSILSISAISLSTMVINGCANPPAVQRIAVDEATDLSGHWNDTDSRLVATEMVNDMLARIWLEKHMEQHNVSPNVIVGYIDNKSHEHISVDTFVNDIERELINSGEITFIADKFERLQLRDERLDQSENATPATRKAIGQELGADYMLIGSINTIIDSAKKQHVVYYQTDLKLLSLVNNRTVWLGQKKIKKLIQGGAHY